MTVTELEILESLDFDYTPPCEHSQHGVSPWHTGPARWVVRAEPFCGCDGQSRTLLICDSAVQCIETLICPSCGLSVPRDLGWTVIGDVK